MDSPTEGGGCHSPGQRSVALHGCSLEPLMGTVQREDSPWNMLSLLSSRPGYNLFPVLADLAGSLAAWSLLSDISSLVRALLDLSMDSDTLLFPLGPWHL